MEGNEGKNMMVGEEMVCEALVPLRPILAASYLCDKRFHTEDYLCYFQSKDEKCKPHGLVWGTGEDVYLYVLPAEEKATHVRIDSISVCRQKGQKKGGQSAPRFARIHDNQIAAFAKLVAERCNTAFMDSHGIPSICSITFGGIGGEKTGIYALASKSTHLNKALAELVCQKPTPAKSIEELIDLSEEKRDQRTSVEESDFVEQFLDHVRRDSGLAVYGPEELIQHASKLKSLLHDPNSQNNTNNKILDAAGPKTKRLTATTAKAKALLSDYGPTVAIAFFPIKPNN